MLSITPADLEGYLDEALPPAEMARIEEALRRDPSLLNKLGLVHSRRDAGGHSLGEIWRRHRLTCPSREQLGAYLLETVSRGEADYITFHLKTVGCRICQANVADLQAMQSEGADSTKKRRRKYFQSSAGYLPK